MEQKIRFLSQEYQLSGMLMESGGEKAVILTHPHPLYGGDMHNPVVKTICRCFAECDYTTMRFNFRGVGDSEGSYGEGIGEQQDVVAAIEYLASLGVGAIDLVGYSFGAWVNAQAPISNYPVDRLVMVSPPVAFLDFGNIQAIDPLRLVITGEQDDIAPVKLVTQAIWRWNPDARFEQIKGADHFYSGRMDDLASAISKHIAV